MDQLVSSVLYRFPLLLLFSQEFCNHFQFSYHFSQTWLYAVRITLRGICYTDVRYTWSKLENLTYPSAWDVMSPFFSLYRNAGHSCWNLGFLFLVFLAELDSYSCKRTVMINFLHFSFTWHDYVLLCTMDCSIRDSSLRNWCPWSWVGKYVRPCRDYENCNEGLGVHSSNGLVTTSMAMMWMSPSQKQGYFSFLAILVTKTTWRLRLYS